MKERPRQKGGLVAVCLLVACTHGDAFAPLSTGDRGTFAEGNFVRLTFNLGDDRTASWLPDGSAFIYSSERVDRRDRDRCLQIIPESRGAVSASICDRRFAHQDSTDRFESPAVSPSGRLLYVRAVSSIGLQKGPRTHLMLGHLESPDASSEITLIPYLASSGRTHGYAAFPVWTGPDDFAYVGQYLWYQGSTFFPDTFTSGLEIMRGHVVGETATLAAVPSTEFASSIASAGNAEEVIATFGGDSRVYRVSLGTGVRTTLWDFGLGNIARDAVQSGSTLVAIVGGSVLFQDEENHGFVQRDEGGNLHIVNLDSGATEVLASDSILFRRPALSPDGRQLVVEVSPFAPVHVGPQSDYNATNHRPDLWLLNLE